MIRDANDQVRAVALFHCHHLLSQLRSCFYDLFLASLFNYFWKKGPQMTLGDGGTAVDMLFF
jgi:hypothetical protein